MKESNLLVSNSVLEIGVETVRSNLVIAFDPPADFRSFAYQKVKARGRNASIIFMDNAGEESNLPARLATYCGIEKKLLEHCSYTDPPYEEGLEADRLGNLWAPYRKSETKKNETPTTPGKGSGPKDCKDDGSIDCSDSPGATDVMTPPSTPPPPGPLKHHKRGRYHSSPPATLRSSIHYLNRYCARLPSDTFTRLTPLCFVKRITTAQGKDAFVCALQLPVNSSLRSLVFGLPAPSETLAKRSAAFEALKSLRALKEVDDSMAPFGKDMANFFKVTNPIPPEKVKAPSSMDDATKARYITLSEPFSRDPNVRTGTTKRRQYYYKQIANSLKAAADDEDSSEKYHLYAIKLKLSCPIPEDQNTRGRKIYPPEDAVQSFGFLVSDRIPQVSLPYHYDVLAVICKQNLILFYYIFL